MYACYNALFFLLFSFVAQDIRIHNKNLILLQNKAFNTYNTTVQENPKNAPSILACGWIKNTAQVYVYGS